MKLPNVSLLALLSTIALSSTALANGGGTWMVTDITAQTLAALGQDVSAASDQPAQLTTDEPSIPNLYEGGITNSWGFIQQSYANVFGGSTSSGDGNSGSSISAGFSLQGESKDGPDVNAEATIRRARIFSYVYTAPEDCPVRDSSASITGAAWVPRATMEVPHHGDTEIELEFLAEAKLSAFGSLAHAKVAGEFNIDAGSVTFDVPIFTQTVGINMPGAFQLGDPLADLHDMSHRKAVIQYDGGTLTVHELKFPGDYALLSKTEETRAFLVDQRAEADADLFLDSTFYSNPSAVRLLLAAHSAYQVTLGN